MGLGEHLDDRVVLELLESLLDPVGSGEGQVSVDPGDVSGVAGESGDSQVDQVLLGPELVRRADLDVARVVRLGHLERTVGEGHLDDREPAPGIEDVGFEGPEEVIAGPVADRVGDDGHDVEDVGQQLDVLLVIGAPAAGRQRLVLTILDVLKDHATPGE